MRRKIVLFSLILTTLFFHLSGAYAQEKADAPVWNVGDKWIFSNKGTIEVISADENSYTLKFSDDITISHRWGLNTIIFDKDTLYRIYTIEGDNRKEYTKSSRRMFNFPFSPGKQWEDVFTAKPVATHRDFDINYYESFRVLGWEDIEVKAGKFKAIKLEVITGHTQQKDAQEFESVTLFWYSPEVKYFVKCEYDLFAQASFPQLVSWELTAFNVKK